MAKASEDEDEGEQDLTTTLQPQTATKNQKASTTATTTPTRPLSSESLLLRELELAPVMMYPQQVSRATEIRLFLSRIESIAIHQIIEREEGVIYFVLDVYRFRQQKGLPSTRSSRKLLTGPHKVLEPETRGPDYQIEQRYSSFARLRANVAHIARKHHPKCRSCSYCSGLLEFLHLTPCKPSLKVKFTTTTEERKIILSNFINELVYVAREDYTSCPRSLRGYHLIPALVKRFLSEQTGESFFS